MIQKENLLRELIKKQILKELKLSLDINDSNKKQKKDNIFNSIIDFFKKNGILLLDSIEIPPTSLSSKSIVYIFGIKDAITQKQIKRIKNQVDTNWDGFLLRRVDASFIIIKSYEEDDDTVYVCNHINKDYGEYYSISSYNDIQHILEPMIQKTFTKLNRNN